MVWCASIIVCHPCRTAFLYMCVTAFLFDVGEESGRDEKLVIGCVLSVLPSVLYCGDFCVLYLKVDVRKGS